MPRLLSNLWTLTRNAAITAVATGILAFLAVSLVRLQGLGEVDYIVLGVLLILSFILNLIALSIVVIAALRPPHDGLMDDRVQQFMISSISAALIAVIGMNNIFQFLAPGTDLLLLVLAVLLYANAPVLFLYAFWHKIEPKP